MRNEPGIAWETASGEAFVRVPPPSLSAQLPFTPGLVADARRALWMSEERVLVAGDLHLGYAWAHRHQGQLLPVAAEDAVERLLVLQEHYQPRELVLIGDIIHRALTLPVIREEVRRLVQLLGSRCRLTFALGNHDPNIERLVDGLEGQVTLTREHRLGPHLLLHGDRPASCAVDGWTIMGHEHPALDLNDGVASQLRCPCFLVGRRVVVLPAFSHWAAGCPVGRDDFLSETARATGFHQAIAIMGDRLLPFPLLSQRGRG